MQNIGEEICGEYLAHIKKCEFVTYNVTNPDIQGEIDVIGINLKKSTIYVCEVAIHTKGLQYVKDKRPDNYNRFVKKFNKNIDYAKKYFKNYKIVPMIWSPIVRVSSKEAKYNPFEELKKVESHFKKNYKIKIELIINERFKEAIDELKLESEKITSEMKSNVMRLFQIERRLDRHIINLNKKNAKELRAKGLIG